MAEKEKNPFGGLKLAAQKGLASIDMEALKEKAAEATGVLKEKAVEVKDAAVAAKDEIADKITELDRMLQGVVTEYNDAYTIMNDKGVQLFVERSRAVDSISFVESLVNSIANRPKSFDAEFEEIHINRKKFADSCEFANLELQEARKAATGAGAGLAAGGGGMAGGTAFLALAGPVGWSIAGATLLTSILIFTTKKTKLNKQKNEEIQAIKQNIELVREMDGKIGLILDETISIRNGLNDMLKKTLPMYGADYLSLADDQKQLLGALINNTKALAALFGKTIGEEDGTET